MQDVIVAILKRLISELGPSSKVLPRLIQLREDLVLVEKLELLVVQPDAERCK